MRAERAGELGRLADDPARLAAQLGVRVDQAAAGEPRVEVQAAGDAVDVVAVERCSDILEVVVRKLVRVVELVAVDQVAEALHGARDLLGDRLGDVVVARADSRPARTG